MNLRRYFRITQGSSRSVSDDTNVLWISETCHLCISEISRNYLSADRLKMFTVYQAIFHISLHIVTKAH